MYCRTIKIPIIGKPTDVELSKVITEERARFFESYPMPIWSIVESDCKVINDGDDENMYYIFVHIYFCYKESAM